MAFNTDPIKVKMKQKRNRYESQLNVMYIIIYKKHIVF